MVMLFINIGLFAIIVYLLCVIVDLKEIKGPK